MTRAKDIIAPSGLNVVAMGNEEQILPHRGRTSVDVDESRILREGFLRFSNDKSYLYDIFIKYLNIYYTAHYEINGIYFAQLKSAGDIRSTTLYALDSIFAAQIKI